MSREHTPIEDPTSATQARRLLRDLGPLDEHEGHSYERYNQTIDAMKEIADQSILAAALVDVESNSSMARMREKIKAAKQITTQIKDMEKAFTSEEDDVAFAVSRNDMAMFNTFPVDDLRIAYKASRHSTTTPSSSVIVHGSRMTYGNTHGGKFADHIDESHYDIETSSGGGSKALVIPLHTLVEEVYPFGNLWMPAMTIGRDAVTDLYANVALHESARFSTHHRTRMGSFAMWRLRQQDEQVKAHIDTITDEFGLHQLWAGQYCDEIAAKVAHVLKGKFTAEDPNKPDNALARVYLRDNGFHFLDQERDLFKPSETDLRHAIGIQCMRLSVSVGDLEVAKAIEYVWGDDPLL